VVRDVSEDWLNRARYLVRERLPRKLDELEQLLSDNEILVARTKGVAVLPPEVAVAYGITGPMLRAVACLTTSAVLNRTASTTASTSISPCCTTAISMTAT